MIRIGVWSRASKFFPMTNQTVIFPYPEGGSFLLCTSQALALVQNHRPLVCVLCALIVSRLRDRLPHVEAGYPLHPALTFSVPSVALLPHGFLIFAALRPVKICLYFEGLRSVVELSPCVPGIPLDR